MEELLAPVGRGSAPWPDLQLPPNLATQPTTSFVDSTPIDLTPGADQSPALPPDLERQVAMSARRAARFAATAEATNIGPEAVEQLRDDVRALAQQYVVQPVASMVGELLLMQDHVMGLLEGKQRPDQTRDLFVIAGLVSGLVAKANHDLHRPHDAMTHARSAYVCAENADHPSLRAWVRGLQSLIAYWAGKPQEAARYAQSGGQEQATGSVSVLLPALEARALAQTSQREATVAALERAAGNRTRVTGDDLDAFGGQFLFPEAKQHYYAAGAYVFLDGYEDDAVNEASIAIGLYEAGDEGVYSFSDAWASHAERVLGRVKGGSLDALEDELEPVLSLRPEKRIGGVVTTAGRIHDALCEPRYAHAPLAVRVRDELEHFCSMPASRLSL